ncbi:hypothetical protein SAMN05216223_104513 [Actinacidiphila yanglinensis]|uniref:PknH-like extracellular domain-containing protein n=1 Tax=Actinacidiphila yanglinensis TaxID=310779 RepID=A0A1H5ZH78_9ACTN|nr:hypothetical protein [Actinacidiphila yanglinensis]SEG35883.1 hypothetical protein SAMN05216223_104513 [Actinacidiphila yanglinensis]
MHRARSHADAPPVRRIRRAPGLRRPPHARAATVAALGLLPALLMAAGCSSGSAHADGGRRTRSSDQASIDAGKAPLSLAQLTRSLVTDKDVPGWVVQMTQTDDGIATTAPAEGFDPDDLGAQDDTTGQSVLVADKPDCQPLADVSSSKPAIHRMASVGATFAKATPKDGATPDEIDQMLIASHAPGDAQKVMASVRRALTGCTSFEGRDQDGTMTSFRITRGPAVKVGDESVAYVMTDTADKKTGAALVTVVRTGDTVTSYLSTKAAGGAGQPPLEVARKEDQKLRTALAARK